MVSFFKFNMAKISGKVACQLAKYGPGSGGTYPGHVFTKIAGQEAIPKLASEIATKRIPYLYYTTKLMLFPKIQCAIIYIWNENAVSKLFPFSLSWSG